MKHSELLQALTSLMILILSFGALGQVLASDTSADDSTNQNWPAFRYDIRHTGNTEGAAPTTSNLLWKYKTDGAVVSSPAVVDGKVYVGSADGYVYSLNANTGELIWKHFTGAWTTSPTVVDGKVFIGSLNPGFLFYCLDAATGDSVWDLEPQGNNVISANAVVINDRVFVGEASIPGVIDAVDENSGAIIWQYQLRLPVSSSAAFANDKIFVGSTDNNIYSLNTDGSLVWKYETGGAIASSAAIADNKVFIGSNDKNVYSVDAANGGIVWKYETGGAVKSSPAIANGNLYVGSDDGYIYCFGASTGIFLTVESYAVILIIIIALVLISVFLYKVRRKRTAKDIVQATNPS